MLIRLGNWGHWQSVALDDAVDRDGRNGVAGSHGTRESGNNSSDEAAQKQSRGNILEPDAVPHGTTPKPRSERKCVEDQEAHKYGCQRQTKHTCGHAFARIDHGNRPCTSEAFSLCVVQAKARLGNRTSIRR